MRDLLEVFLKKDDLPHKVWEYAWITPETISFTEEVRAACEKNYCGCYGTCWNCPPGIGDWKELRDHFLGYANAFVFTTKHDLEDSFDLDGMNEGRVKHEALLRALGNFLNASGVQGKTYEILGAGGCHICEKCSYPDAPCRHPELVFRSMEACGIDVVALSRACEIHYINGENTVTYFSVLFW